MKVDIKFVEWVAEKITTEQLEYNYSDELWYYESESYKLMEFTTEGLYKLYNHQKITKS